MWFLGVDPGKSGAIGCIDERASYVDHVKLKETPRDVADWLAELLALPDRPRIVGTLERVASRPGQGVSSTFKFGWSAGFVEGLLVANRIPFEPVTPAKWQSALHCRTRGDKNITKAAAQRLWPDTKITHANADALLLAEYGRQRWRGNHT